jgi:hypothetical protein
MAGIDINQMIADALRESTTRVGKIDPNQMKLMSDALQTAGGVYGNQLTAENNTGIQDINQQTTDLAKKNSLNYNAPAAPNASTAPGVGMSPAGARPEGGYPIGIPEQLNPTNPNTILSRFSDGTLPRDNRLKKGLFSTMNIGDISAALKKFEGGM